MVVLALFSVTIIVLVSKREVMDHKSCDQSQHLEAYSYCVAVYVVN